MSLPVIAVLDATSPTGEALLDLLASSGFPYQTVYALARAEQVDQKASVGEAEWPLLDIESFDWSGVDLCFVTGDQELAAEVMPELLAAGCKVIDDTAFSRREADVPLLNPDLLDPDWVWPESLQRIAVPSALALAIASVSSVFAKLASIRSIDCASYQSVSGAGQAGLDALVHEVQALFNGHDIDPSAFYERIAFNLLPQIGELHHGHSAEELKLRDEIPRQLGLPHLEVTATCVRMPVFFGHAAVVNWLLDHEPDMDILRQQLRETESLMLDESADAVPGLQSVVGQTYIVLSRLRCSSSKVYAFVMLDNLRAGAALPALRLGLRLLGVRQVSH